MGMFERIIQDQVFIDFGCEVLYGDDQMYLDYPTRFATVGFQLMSTSGLCQIADRIRKDLGFVPMHPMDEYTDETCDQNGWYDFFIGLNDWDRTKVDRGGRPHPRKQKGRLPALRNQKPGEHHGGPRTADRKGDPHRRRQDGTLLQDGQPRLPEPDAPPQPQDHARP